MCSFIYLFIYFLYYLFIFKTELTFTIHFFSFARNTLRHQAETSLMI